MKILLLSPNQIKRYNWGHQLFRNALSKQHNVIYYGEGYKGYNSKITVPDLEKMYQPDIILTYGFKYTRPFKGLGKIRNTPKVHIAVDYFPNKGRFKATLLEQNKFFARNKPDLVFGVVGQVVRNLRKYKICNKIFLLPFSVNTDIYKRKNLPKTVDVLASFTTRETVYPNRKKVQRLVRSMGLNVFTDRITQKKLVNKINCSKIIITSNNIYSSLSMRYTEVLACGGFLLADKPEDFDDLGYINNRHLVLYKDFKDLKKKILYYLPKKKLRQQIAKQGMEFVRKNHSNKIRVKKFTEIIECFL